MALKVLVVPDKFKGTLTAREAADAIAEGWAEVRPEDHLEIVPMADGGDGFGEVVGSLVDAQRWTCDTIDCAGRARTAEWWLTKSGEVAVVEAAQVNGLALLPKGKYHPFELDTFGLGAVLYAARAAGARSIYVGLGGSATNDGGFGLARALGFRFWAAEQREILAWTDLVDLVSLEPPRTAADLSALVIAVDVTNPLLGPLGASRVYGPQKGLLPEDVAHAEACLRRLAKVTEARLRCDVAEEPGSGAAGGLGFALRAFCRGHFRSGADVFARFSRLGERIERADLVITGEGALDAQSSMGKGVGTVAQAARESGKRCVCLAGSVASDVVWGEGFSAFAIVPGVADESESKARPAECLRRLAASVAEQETSRLG